jgi:hypothetical protein
MYFSVQVMFISSLLYNASRLANADLSSIIISCKGYRNNLTCNNANFTDAIIDDYLITMQRFYVQNSSDVKVSKNRETVQTTLIIVVVTPP